MLIKAKDAMILNMINSEREKQLLKTIKTDAEELNNLLIENCD